MAQVTIEAGAINFTPFSIVGDKAVWRKEDPALPPMFRPTLTLTARKNSTGTNVNVTLKSVTPIVSIVDGTSVSRNSRVATFSYTSLQNVVDETAGADIDAMIAALTALKSQFVNGRVD